LYCCWICVEVSTMQIALINARNVFSVLLLCASPY